MSAPWVQETVRWRGGRVRILDQRRLPGEEVYLELATPDEVIEAIRELAVRGAPAIGVSGAMGLALAAERIAREEASDPLGALRREETRIAAARPTAVNLRWACRRAFAAGERAAQAGGGTSGVAAAVRAEAERILEEDLALSAAMARHGAALLPDEGAVLTHCNTGGLATAGGGTALGAVFEAHRRGKRILVHVDETRPLLQGARLTAWELERAGVPYRVQCDGAAAWLLRSRKVDAVLVGADRIARNGDTANKLGTLSLAIAARSFGVPFYVVAPSSSFDPDLADGEAIPIEERDDAEVLAFGGVRTAPAGARGWNPAFDVTPGDLITAWVTEFGPARPPFGSPGKTNA